MTGCNLAHPKSDKKKTTYGEMELKTPVMADGASTRESEFGTNLREKEKADHDPSFCLHLLSFAVLASLPKRLSHNLTNGP